MKKIFSLFALLFLVTLLPVLSGMTSAQVVESSPLTRLKIDAAKVNEPSTGTSSVASPDKTQLETTQPLVIDRALLEKIESRKEQVLKPDETAPKRSAWPVWIQGIFSEYWVQFLALIVSVIGVILAVSGFSLANKKKRKFLRRYLKEIDEAYVSYKMRSKRCEAEMIRLQDMIEDRLKEGKLDENSYHLLEQRIEKYLQEIKNDNGGKEGL